MNGTSIYNTHLAAAQAGLAFPRIPDVNTILNLDHTSKPVFYGQATPRPPRPRLILYPSCYEDFVPLVLYAADFPYSAYTNLSSFVDYLSPRQLENLTDNARYLISQDTNQQNGNWTQCVACGSILRSLQRMNWSIPQQCQSCFKEYCWDGTVRNSPPGYLEPTLVKAPQTSWVEWNASFYGAVEST